MIWATVGSWSCFCWLYRASSSLAAKNIINLILVLTIWWCPCVESSLVLLEEGVCYDQCVLLAKLIPYSKAKFSRYSRIWSTGEGNGKPLQYSCLENLMNSMKRQNDRILKGELPGSIGAQYVLEISGEITPERMKGWNQSKNNTQLWMWLVIEARSNAVKSNIA